MMGIKQMIMMAGMGAGLVLTAGQSMAEVTGATVANAAQGNYNLTSVTVTRGSAGSITYLPSQITGVDLTDVAAYNVPIMSQANSSIPAPGTRATLLEDNRLDTGVTSPVTYVNPIDLSFEVTFLRPVVNSVGDDIVIFSLDGGTTTRFYINNSKSQYVDVVMTGAPKVVSGVPVKRYGYSNPNPPAGHGATTVYDLEELESPVGYFFATDLSYDVYAATIDLSSFGLAEGESITSMRYQAVSGRINTVYIGGLPVVVPEPASVSVLVGLMAAGLLRRPVHEESMKELKKV